MTKTIKIITITAVAAVLLLGGGLLLQQSGYLDKETSDEVANGNEQEDEAEEEPEVGEEVTITGLVLENTNEPCAYPDESEDPCIADLPGNLMIETDAGHVAVNYYYGFTQEQCVNTEAMQVGELVRTGERVEVYGLVLEPDHFSNANVGTCSSDEYYINVL